MRVGKMMPNSITERLAFPRPAARRVAEGTRHSLLNRTAMTIVAYRVGCDMPARGQNRTHGAAGGRSELQRRIAVGRLQPPTTEVACSLVIKMRTTLCSLRHFEILWPTHPPRPNTDVVHRSKLHLNQRPDMTGSASFAGIRFLGARLILAASHPHGGRTNQPLQPTLQRHQVSSVNRRFDDNGTVTPVRGDC